jgi:hypothetical protein
VRTAQLQIAHLRHCFSKRSSFDGSFEPLETFVERYPLPKDPSHLLEIVEPTCPQRIFTGIDREHLEPGEYQMGTKWVTDGYKTGT